MSVTPEPEHMSNRHRTTLRRIFEHPVSHNIEWREVVSLLDAVATTVEQHGGKLDVTIAAVSGVLIVFTIAMMILMERVAGLSRRLR